MQPIEIMVMKVKINKDDHLDLQMLDSLIS